MPSTTEEIESKYQEHTQQVQIGELPNIQKEFWAELWINKVIHFLLRILDRIDNGWSSK
ncbi:MAG: hypothetical protein ACHQ1H_00415 [Nitrososphaerales archaeon]